MYYWSQAFSRFFSMAARWKVGVAWGRGYIQHNTHTQTVCNHGNIGLAIPNHKPTNTLHCIHSLHSALVTNTGTGKGHSYPNTFGDILYSHLVKCLCLYLCRKEMSTACKLMLNNEHALTKRMHLTLCLYGMHTHIHTHTHTHTCTPHTTHMHNHRRQHMPTHEYWMEEILPGVKLFILASF